MLKKVSSTLFLGLALALCVLGCSKTQQAAEGGGAGGRRGAGGQGQQAVPISAAKAVTQDVPVYLNGLGSVEAFNTVTVKSRVDGPIIAVNFKEGQNVRKG